MPQPGIKYIRKYWITWTYKKIAAEFTGKNGQME
jgi:hypothetical protein